MKFVLLIAIYFSVVIVACESKPEPGADAATADTANTVSTNSASATADTASAVQNPDAEFDAATTNEETAKKLASFLQEKYRADLKDMTEQDRSFSFYEIDLNDDNKNEFFIYQQGRYFCGSGGCSFYLLNNDLSVNTHFTVTNPPVFRSSAKTNGWHDLILFGDYNQDGGVKNYIHLKFDKSKKAYPSNPSVIKKMETAPAGHDRVMWSDDFSKAKGFTF